MDFDLKERYLQYCISIGLKHNNHFKNKVVRDITGNNRILFYKCDYSSGNKFSDSDLFDTIIDVNCNMSNVPIYYGKLRAGGLLIGITENIDEYKDFLNIENFRELGFLKEDGKIKFHGIKDY